MATSVLIDSSSFGNSGSDTESPQKACGNFGILTELAISSILPGFNFCYFYCHTLIRFYARYHLTIRANKKIGLSPDFKITLIPAAYFSIRLPCLLNLSQPGYVFPGPLFESGLF